MQHARHHARYATLKLALLQDASVPACGVYVGRSSAPPPLYTYIHTQWQAACAYIHTLATPQACKPFRPQH